MQIELTAVSKRFAKEWIFKDLTYTIQASERLAILGNNGSGKSTLLQIISAALSPSKGEIVYKLNDINLSSELLYKHLGIVSPYMELVEEMTAIELINFHFSFKNRFQKVSNEELLALFGYANITDKYIKNFSSGMKQRLKLLLSVFSDVPLLLLDEPCANLDTQGITWYQELLEKYAANRTIVIASNQSFEYEMCTKHLNIVDYKLG